MLAIVTQKGARKLREFIVAVMDRYGYAGVFFLILIENLFPPIPSEVILPFGGFMTTYTNMSVWGTVFFSTLGSTIGALILYRIGKLLCISRLERVLDSKLCRLLGFEKEKVETTMKWFEKKGRSAVLLGRCVPMIRSLISIPAGMAQMNTTIFLVYTVIGSVVWNFALISLGAALGASWEYIGEWISAYSDVIHVVVTGLIVVWGVWQIVKRVKKLRS